MTNTKQSPNQASLLTLAISDSGFIFDPRTGHSFSANTTGLTVVKQLRQGLDVDSIVRSLQERHGASPRIAQDVYEFVNVLNEFGWAPGIAAT